MPHLVPSTLTVVTQLYGRRSSHGDSASAVTGDHSSRLSALHSAPAAFSARSSMLGSSTTLHSSRSGFTSGGSSARAGGGGPRCVRARYAAAGPKILSCRRASRPCVSERARCGAAARAYYRGHDRRSCGTIDATTCLGQASDGAHEVGQVARIGLGMTRPMPCTASRPRRCAGGDAGQHQDRHH